MKMAKHTMVRMRMRMRMSGRPVRSSILERVNLEELSY
jgi:hypothetical protein